jgi:hypothetical protein
MKSIVLSLVALSFMTSAHAAAPAVLKTGTCHGDTAPEQIQVSSFELNGTKFKLWTAENPVNSLLWMRNGAVVAQPEGSPAFPIGRGDPLVSLSQCSSLTLELPADEVEVSVRRGLLPLVFPIFCGDHNGYTGPCVVRENRATAKLKFVRRGGLELTFKTVNTQYYYEGEWHDE